MFIGDSDIWNIFSEYARNLGLLEKTIKTAKQDYDTFRNDHYKVRREVYNKYANRLNTSISWNNFEWFDGLSCFYLLQFHGFRHTALRELRHYLEVSVRSYYIDIKYKKQSLIEKKVLLFELFEERKGPSFNQLIKTLSAEEQIEMNDLWKTLCGYVHFSKKQLESDLGNFVFNLTLELPYYEDDKEILFRTFNVSCQLLHRSFS